MIIGIVGSEAKKFTEVTEQAAREIIRQLISVEDVVVSGECHLGGVDIYAKEEAIKAGIKYVGFPPKRKQWDGGYKERNLQIAETSEIVICITLRSLPKGFYGMRFPMCYHCMTDKHVKSGGCWTVKQAKRIGKEGYVITI